jgi:hypothetical protein
LNSPPPSFSFVIFPPIPGIVSTYFSIFTQVYIVFSFCCAYALHFVYSSADTHSDCFHLMDSVAMNIGVQSLFATLLSIFSDIHAEVGLLGYIVLLF